MVQKTRKFEGKNFADWGATHSTISLAQNKSMLRRKGYAVRTEPEENGKTRIYVRKRRSLR